MSDPIVSYLELRLKDYIEDLRTLVNIDSGSYCKSGVDAVNDWLVDRLTSLGLTVQRFPQTDFGDDIYGSIAGTGNQRILLLGHSDTVFPQGTVAKRPMSMQANRIFGPGTCDMKAGLLTGIYAIEALRHIGFVEYGSLSFLCVSDEEIGGDRHSRELVQSSAREVDAVLTLEAARENGDIVSARKGVCWYSLEAFGKSAHAGVEPEKGRNAIVALAQQISGLQSLNEFKQGMTVNPGTIEGGTAPNVVPDYAKIRIDLRTMLIADKEDFERAVNEKLEKTVYPGINFVFKQESDAFTPPMERTKAVELLEGLAKLAAHELGFEVEGATTGGASDASIASAEGTPALDGLGPIGGLDHSPDEYIEIDSIVPRTALLAKLIIAISQKEKERKYG